MTKQEILRQPAWTNYPKLRHFANHALTEEETAQLLQVLEASVTNPGLLLEDNPDLASAFYWHESPQGDHYWRDICNRLAGEALPAYDPDATFEPDNGQAVGETGWQPDIVDGASVMDITRSLF